jgi:DNA-binding transcriptional MerR regulator
MERMSDGTGTLKIGELAARCGVSRDTICFYERETLLPRPRRTASRYRVYSEDDEERVRFIRQAQAIGFSLDNIRELVRERQLHTPGECQHVAQLLRDRIDVLDRKIDELRAFRGRLAASLRRCESVDSARCPVIVDLSKPAAKGRRGE